MVEVVPLTLSIIHTQEDILLAMKKRGFGSGKWNGYGGKPLPGESITEAAIREVKEESGLVVNEIQSRGVLRVYFESPPNAFDLHLFNIVQYTGEAIETEEMRPAWIKLSEIPYDHMWKVDKVWLPEFLKGKSTRGTVWFKDQDTLLRHSVEFYIS